MILCLEHWQSFYQVCTCLVIPRPGIALYFSNLQIHVYRYIETSPSYFKRNISIVLLHTKRGIVR